MRLVLAEDSVLLREGLARLLNEVGFEVVGQAGDGEEVVRLVRRERPDVVIVDIRMPPSYSDEGFRAAQAIREHDPSVGVLVLSQYVDAGYVMRLLAEGAEGLGYLLKDRVSDLEELADAVRRVGVGGCVVDPEVVSRLLHRPRQGSQLDALTERELGVLKLMAQGRSNHAIASRLFLSEKTVEAHVRSIFTKLDLTLSSDDHRRVLAVLRYLRSRSGTSAGDGEDAAPRPTPSLPPWRPSPAVWGRTQR
jgi:DNA-binding NarL/FixJ family response regulator